jgi:hypothetical protein
MGHLAGQTLYFSWLYALAAKANNAGNSAHD